MATRTKTACEVVAEKGLAAVKKLREKGVESVAALNTYLKQNNIDVEPPHGAIFALNIILHVFVLFLALTVLYKFVISPLESRTLQNEVDDKLIEAMQVTIASATPDARKAIGEAMYVAMPVLNRSAYAFTQPDDHQTQNNSAVFIRAWLIVGFLAVLFVVVAAVLGSCKVNLAPHIKHVIGENVLIFAIIGIVEFCFFQFVAKKFVPTLPSQLGQDALSAAQQEFATAPPPM